MGKTVVVSAVNIVDGGALTVLKDAILSFEKNARPDDRYYFLVSSSAVHQDLSCNNIQFIYFEKSKKSWLYRLYYEYINFYFLSKKLNPDIWLSLHDTTPNVACKKRLVYCHNPSIFLDFPLKDFRLDPKQFLFSKLYKYLYKLNIKKNSFVITQQAWMAGSFEGIFGIENLLVAAPDTSDTHIEIAPAKELKKPAETIKEIFYPSFPRYFKNHAIIYNASRIFPDIKFTVTINGTETPYIRKIEEKGTTPNLNKVGLLPRQKVYDYYSSCDALLFPSLLETWGLPLTEFKAFNKPIICADLPYAHETLGNYKKIYWFDPTSEASLESAINRFLSNAEPDAPKFVECPYKKLTGWDALTLFILEL